MKRLIFLTLISLSVQVSFAVVRTAVKTDGDWSDGTTWSGGVVPTYGDSVVIPAGKKVTFDLSANQSYPNISSPPLKINVLGWFYFPNGKKLAMPCGSVVYVGTNGVLSAENVTGGGNVNSSIIDICNHTVWNAGLGTVSDTIFRYDSPLPIELYSFYAKCNGKVTLTWSTESETNNDYFTLERSTNVKDWEFVANIPGARNSNMTLNYQFTDEKSLSGISYYRLRQTDFDGKNETFSPVSVICSSSEIADINMYPNPFKGELIIKYSNLSEGIAEVKVYDMMGKMILNHSIEISTGSNDYILDLRDMADGLYNVEFTSGNTRFHQKMLKN
jgi:hypothetical protein